MKVLLIGFAKLKYMPYINFYLEGLAKQNAQIHILYWNRDTDEDIPLADNITKHEFKLAQKDEVPKWSKIRGFMKFRRFAKKVINEYNFDKLVVMSTIPAVLLSDLLIKNWNNKFIFDYRDYTYEWFPVYKAIVQGVVRCSKVTFISSDAFRNAMPKLDNILTTHNLQLSDLNHRDVRQIKERTRNVLRLSFWGFIRHEGINKQIIQALGNDPRFEVHYYGREQQTALNLKAFVAEKEFQNIFFHGTYKPQDRYQFASQTDILLNTYENDAATKKAMGNKFYDGIIFYLPQICTEGSYMGQTVMQSHVGIVVLPDKKMGDEIWKYYNSINWTDFESKCDIQLEKILREYRASIRQIENL